MNIVEVFPNYQKIHNKKDPGQIPFWLTRCGNKVTIVTDNKTVGSEEFDLIGIEIVQLPDLKFLGIHLSIVWHILKNTKEIDVLFLFHLTFNTAVLSLLFKFFSKKGIVVVKLDTDGRLYKESIPLFFRIYHILFGETKIVPRVLSYTSDVIFIESPHSKDRILMKYPFLKDKILVLPNGINDEMWMEQKNKVGVMQRDNKILFVGSICYRKGVDILIKAFANVASTYSQWKLDIVGPVVESTYKEYLDKLIYGLGLCGRVIFSWNLDGIELLKKYLECSLLCLPSRYENFPTVIIEAMFLEIPIISSNVGCVDYILDYGKCGIIFESENVNELSLQLNTILSDEQKRKNLSIVAKERVVKLFLWKDICKKMNEKLLDVYRKKYEN